ncbi:cuticle-degrading protease [Ceratobasidium sp. AG-Ba]|nr:cuticle-degrading protease [Ceratobasidium sp. AG-Ba]
MLCLLWWLLAEAVLGLTSPTLDLKVIKSAGEVKPNSYIVKLKAGILKPTHLDGLSRYLQSTITHTYYEGFDWYAAILDTSALDYIRRSEEVEAIYEDEIIQVNYEHYSTAQLQQRRTDSPGHKRAGGSSADIYVIDTGIYLQHSEFGGRAFWGATFGGYANADGNGHGTYLAGVAAGATYGTAPQARVYAVKVASDSGGGTMSDFIAGLNWVVTAAKSSGRPSIVLTAIGSSTYSSAFDAAVQNVINNGIHFVAAAGSDGAGTPTSPRVANAIVVGAVDSTGRKTAWSNYAQGIIYYYGVNIKGAWIGSTTATNTISGTTASVAGVAGILAKVIDAHGNQTPAALKADLMSHAQYGSGAPTTVLIATPW